MPTWLGKSHHLLLSVKLCCSLFLIMKLVIYGGLFGSEGKGCASEHYATIARRESTAKLLVFGENAPNSGHSCNAGKTRNLPACSYYADAVALGPDAVINPAILIDDILNIRSYRLKNRDKFDKPLPDILIHEHCGVMLPGDEEAEQGVVQRVSSTGSGSGAARVAKVFGRHPERVISNQKEIVQKLVEMGVRFVGRYQWFTMIHSAKDWDWIFECSQGSLLDCNWGYYPHCTARTTLPRSVVDRNGLSGWDWGYVGVYRTFPIRTGGPSGPTGGDEMQWEDLGLPPEIATVTKRTRRVFRPSADDVFLSLRLTQPDVVMFTHGDYLFADAQVPDDEGSQVEAFLSYCDEFMLDFHDFPKHEMYASFAPGKFIMIPLAPLRAVE